MREEGEHFHHHGHDEEGHAPEHAEHGHRPGEECGCGHHGGRRQHQHQGGECGCGCHGRGPGHAFRRRFFTGEERIAWLEEYLKKLQAEASGVEEHIAELKAGK